MTWSYTAGGRSQGGSPKAGTTVHASNKKKPKNAADKVDGEKDKQEHTG